MSKPDKQQVIKNFRKEADQLQQMVAEYISQRGNITLVEQRSNLFDLTPLQKFSKLIQE